MKLSCRIVLLIFAALFCDPAYSQSPKKLIELYQQWKTDVGFRSTYVLRVGGVAIASEAFENKIPFQSPPRVMRGVFHKKPGGGLVRHSVTYDQELKHSETPEGLGLVSNLPFDELRQIEGGWDAYLSYVPRQGKDFDTATYTRRESSLTCLSGLDSEVTPLKPELAKADTLPGIRMAWFKEADYSVSPLSPQLLELRADGTDSGGIRRTAAWEFSMQFPMPMLSRIKVTRYSKDGIPVSLMETRLTGFRQSGDQFIASRVTLALYDPSAKDKSIFVVDWVSEDIGEKQPAESDFVIEIPATTRIVGLKDPESVGAVRRISLEGISQRIAEDPLSPARAGAR